LANSLFQVRSYLSYWLNAVDQHSLHSPFFFDFYKNVIRRENSEHTLAEKLRQQLLNDNRSITVTDLGTGSNRERNRRLSDIAQSSLSTRKLSGLYSRIIEHYNCKKIVELGTSLGINTLYLSEQTDATIATFEGSEEISSIAELTFQFAGVKNITLIKGNIDDTLPSYLNKIKKIDFAFLDANHTYDATNRYFEKILTRIHEKSIVVIDDIHNSKGMQDAWNRIRKNDLVYASADLYRCGILLFDPSLNKQHVILQF
jgi:predicted O-methyltransferase YrrM